MAKDQRIPFSDRSPRLFDFILNYYRTGLLVGPEDTPDEVRREELDFWGLPFPQKIPPSNGEILVDIANNMSEFLQLPKDGYLKGERGPPGERGF